MLETLPLVAIALLLAVGVIAIALNRAAEISTIVYGATTAISVALVIYGLVHLVASRTPIEWTLPLGLPRFDAASPWLGAHFRVDALSAFFLIVVNLGAAAASFYAIGYGAHEEAPHRVLPFYAGFLAGMNLV